MSEKEVDRFVSSWAPSRSSDNVWRVRRARIDAQGEPQIDYALGRGKERKFSSLESAKIFADKLNNPGVKQ